MKFLFISAHPDDLEFSAANLIRYLTNNKKHDVEILCLTKGEFGTYSAEQVGTHLAQVRVRELQKAARINGVKPENIHFADIIDGFLKFTRNNIKIVTEWLNQIQPDIIFAPEAYYAYYWQQDHINCGRISYRIFSSYQYELVKPIKSLYFYATLKPNFYWPFNDITMGKASLYQHKSQLYFLKWIMAFYSIEKFNFYKRKTGKWNYIEPYRRISKKRNGLKPNRFFQALLGIMSHLPFFNPTGARYHVSKGNTSFAHKVRKLTSIYYPKKHKYT
jgi:LmbE family N-acetylglucosaminyl deacetylase